MYSENNKWTFMPIFYYQYKLCELSTDQKLT